MNRIVYIHIPRTGGNTIISALSPNKNLHIIRHDLRDPNYKFYQQQSNPEDTVIIVVRNPISRLYSAYSYLRKGGLHEPDALDAYILGLNTLTFEEFILFKLEDASKWQIHFIPQFKWIRGVMAPKIYKFENISSEIERMCRENKLESSPLLHLNKSTPNFPHKIDISKKCERIIKKVYKDDYKMFGY
jgi:hypothetical protein